MLLLDCHFLPPRGTTWLGYEMVVDIVNIVSKICKRLSKKGSEPNTFPSPFAVFWKRHSLTMSMLEKKKTGRHFGGSLQQRRLSHASTPSEVAKPRPKLLGPCFSRAILLMCCMIRNLSCQNFVAPLKEGAGDPGMSTSSRILVGRKTKKGDAEIIWGNNC